MFLEDLPNRNKIVSTSSNANDKLFDAMKANKVKNSADIIDHTVCNTINYKRRILTILFCRYSYQVMTLLFR